MEQQLNRVALNLNQAIVEFWAKRVAAEEPRFTSTELRQHVQHYNYGTAPARSCTCNSTQCSECGGQVRTRTHKQWDALREKFSKIAVVEEEITNDFQ